MCRADAIKDVVPATGPIVAILMELEKQQNTFENGLKEAVFYQVTEHKFCSPRAAGDLKPSSTRA
jgi:hypothetical protein